MALLYTVAFALPVDAFAYSRAIPCGWPAGTNKCWQAIPCGWPAGLRPADKRREDRGSTGCGFIISARRVAGPRRLVATGRGQLCLAAIYTGRGGCSLLDADTAAPLADCAGDSPAGRAAGSAPHGAEPLRAGAGAAF